jgi:YegS/Rv2252/BmrU family lipid kinase
MKIKFIVNPVSGTGKQKNIERYINQYLDKNKFDYNIRYTEKKEHAKEICKLAIKEKYNIIIAVGGDGTVNEIASELIDTNITLGVIPCGSGNGFAYHIGMNKNIAKAVKQINNSDTQIIDSCTANGDKFINVSGIGFDAHIANLFSGLKQRGFWNYIKLIFKELNYKSRKYTLEYNSEVKEINALLISFANATQYGNNFKISPNSDLSDGKIDFVIVKNMKRWQVPQFLLKIARGKIQQSEHVEIIQTKEMKILSDDKIIHLDGEVKQINKNVIVKCNPKSLKILVPNGKK